MILAIERDLEAEIASARAKEALGPVGFHHVGAQYLEKLLNLEYVTEGNVGEPQNNPVDIFQRTLTLIKESRFNELINFVEKIESRDLILSETYNNLGYAFTKAPDKENAIENSIKYFELASKLNPDNFIALKNTAFACFKNGEYDKSSDILGKYIQHIQSDMQVYELLGFIKDIKGNLKESLEYYLFSVEKLGNLNPIVFHNIGEIHRKNNEYDKAIEFYLDSIEHSHEDILNTYIDLGISYGMNNQHQESIDILKKSVELFPDEPKTYHNLGVSYEVFARNLTEHQKLYYQRKAIRAFNKVLEIDANNLDAKFHLGILYNSVQDFTQAATIFEELIQIKYFRELICYNQIGYAYFNLGKYDKAVESLTVGVELFPDDYLMEYFLGLSYQLLRDKENSTSHFDLAITKYEKHKNKIDYCFFVNASFAYASFQQVSIALDLLVIALAVSIDTKGYVSALINSGLEIPLLYNSDDMFFHHLGLLENPISSQFNLSDFFYFKENQFNVYKSLRFNTFNESNYIYCEELKLHFEKSPKLSENSFEEQVLLYLGEIIVEIWHTPPRKRSVHQKLTWRKLLKYIDMKDYIGNLDVKKLYEGEVIGKNDSHIVFSKFGQKNNNLEISVHELPSELLDLDIGEWFSVVKSTSKNGVSTWKNFKKIKPTRLEPDELKVVISEMKKNKLVGPSNWPKTSNSSKSQEGN